MSLDLDAIKARLAAACPGPWTGMTIYRSIDGNCLALARQREVGGTTIAATLLPGYSDLDTVPLLLHAREDMDALVAEVERLRAEAQAERAAVVAWLRAKANAEHPIERGVPSLSPAGRGLLLLHADRIERGEHRREEKP